MAWQNLSLLTQEAYVAAMSDFLETSEAVAITWQAADEQALFEPDPDTTPLWSLVEVNALFPEHFQLEELIQQLRQRFTEKVILNCQIKPIADQPWERLWLNDFQPMCFGQRLWVCPHGFAVPDPKGTIVWLDPGLAFGTGTHPSTALCLEWLDAQMQIGQTVLDYGCGSGILSLAAIQCGASQVWAVDHDPQALESTQANAIQNQIRREQILVFSPEQFHPPEKVDVLIANILAEPLTQLAERFAQYVKKGGRCVLAGILREQVTRIQDHYAQAGFRLVDVAYKEEWARLHLQQET
ncbi:50S ribosomal protein L11 methyltransferase [Rickettsiella massiliensis]|uniref:50S ribosomal protein L11 methyltransferase n=1 Tax=Rickettsiella massiliensis TaxID=676517 RepID=UPI00029A1B2F|nr:50S ribosomal protein L11 methyltransferase [Rickettsiella massiliensis]